LRVRPDFYVKRWRHRINSECHLAKLDTARAHMRFMNQVEKHPDRAVEYGEQLMDAFDAISERRVQNALDITRAESWINLMLPKGVEPAERAGEVDYWRLKMFGRTPNECHWRTRQRVIKHLKATRHLREAVPVTAPVGSGADVIKWLMGIASNEPWYAAHEQELYQLLKEARDVPGASVDVIDHFEHLATLDDTTCDECSAADGNTVDVGEMGSMFSGDELAEGEAVLLVALHPNCRCVPVPVSKTWEELGFEPEQEPEGTRISRMGPSDEGYTRKASPSGYRDPETGVVYYPTYNEFGRVVDDGWQPGRAPVGGNQGYVPADVRHGEWQQAKDEMNTTRVGA